MGATERELQVQEWPGYFGWIAFASSRMLAAVEVVDECVGVDVPLRVWRPLRAINYDAEEDVLTLAVGGEGDGARCLPLRYFVYAPRMVSVTEATDAWAILVKDATGTRTLIRLSNESDSSDSPIAPSDPSTQAVA